MSPWPQASKRSASSANPSTTHDVGGRVRYGIRRTGRSPLIGPPHEGGAIADTARRIEVEIVARHHQDFARFDREKPGGAQISFGKRLVDAQHLARDHGIPIDAIVTRDIHDQRQAEDRERDTDAVPPQSAQRRGEIRPGIKPVPLPCGRATLLRRAAGGG